MSPRKITRFGLIVGGVSLVGGIGMVFMAQPEWGWLNWWPAFGLLLSLLLLVAAVARGAYLTMQKRVEMVDLLNDCYSGNPEKVR